MIRFAKPGDSKKVAQLIIQAMGDLALKFTNSNNPDAALPLFEYFFKLPGNQYSYQNTLVYQDPEKGVAGSINAYDGAKLEAYRKPFFNYLAKNYGLVDFKPEAETQAGEFYLDTISVNPDMQGKGIGKLLILAGLDLAKKLGHKQVALLVEVKNERALKLYQKVGFKMENEKQFIGSLYYHMVYKVV